MRKTLSVSIVIPTLNRKDVLTEALLSLNGVDYPRNLLEVIVVNDGSTDGTRTAVSKIRRNLNYRLIFINSENKGISHAKNVAMKKAHGEIIVTTDDDCLFEKGWLKKLVKPLINKKVGSVGGPDRAVKNESILAKCIDFAFSSFIGSGGIHGRFFKMKLGNIYPPGCNMAFRKEVIKEIGYFDETLAPGEDTDYNHRIEEVGYKLKHVPMAFVWHRPRNSVKRFIPYIFKRGKARVEIIRRHPGYREFIYFLPAIMVIGGVVLIIISLINSMALSVLVLLVLVYFVLLISAGISAFRTYQDPICIFLVPLLIFLQHIFHGLGFLRGVVNLIFSGNVD